MDIASKQGVQNLQNKIFFCVAYEITLLSNQDYMCLPFIDVSTPYEITLLSNYIMEVTKLPRVSVPYEITLLSNLKFQIQVFTK